GPAVRSLTMANWQSAGSLWSRRWVTGLRFSRARLSAGRAARGPDQATAAPSTATAPRTRRARFIEILRDGTASARWRRFYWPAPHNAIAEVERNDEWWMKRKERPLVSPRQA